MPLPINPSAHSKIHAGPLYGLLVRRLPKQYRFGTGYLNVSAIATDLGVSREGCYKWLRLNRLSPGAAKRLIELSDGMLTVNQISKSVI